MAKKISRAQRKKQREKEINKKKNYTDKFKLSVLFFSLRSVLSLTFSLIQ